VNYVASETSEIFRLAVENIPPLWDQLEPLITASFFDTPTLDAEDVFRMLMAHRAHAFVQISMDEPGVVQALCVTDFDVYPKGVWLRVWLCAATKGYRLNRTAMRHAIEAWKKTERCKGLVLIGRPGWTKLFPEASIEGVIMRITDPPEGDE
jgi:hypothetical protein